MKQESKMATVHVPIFCQLAIPHHIGTQTDSTYSSLGMEVANTFNNVPNGETFIYSHQIDDNLIFIRLKNNDIERVFDAINEIPSNSCVKICIGTVENNIAVDLDSISDDFSGVVYQKAFLDTLTNVKGVHNGDNIDDVSVRRTRQRV